MATQVDVCSGAPPCFRLEAAGCVVLDARLFPTASTAACRTVLSVADLDELAVCRKVGNPAVNMTVRQKDGTSRDMRPDEREDVYCNRWFRRLHKKCRAVPNPADWECCLCLNCDRRVYLVGPHLRAQEDATLSSALDCDHLVCLNCLLKHAFRRRGFALAPQCPFCNVAFDEDELVPLLLTHGG